MIENNGRFRIDRKGLLMTYLDFEFSNEPYFPYVEETVSIPDRVRGIHPGALKLVKDTVKVIYMPEGLEWIGPGAFLGYAKLERVVFHPGKRIKIGKEAFKDCPCLREVSPMESVAEVGEDAFAGTPFGERWEQKKVSL
ncbi:MAG: leucine-rich repeat protein [Oscillospiraceae bacterium]|nr:leucine-rich repeat protein [Oscillospiraceae bacterium]